MLGTNFADEPKFLKVLETSFLEGSNCGRWQKAERGSKKQELYRKTSTTSTIMERRTGLQFAMALN